MLNFWPQVGSKTLQCTNISYILYISESPDRPVTKLTTGIPAVQFSLGLNNFYLLRNVQIANYLHANSYSIESEALVQGQHYQDVNIIIALHLMPKLKVSGITHPIQLQFVTECISLTQLTHFKIRFTLFSNILINC